MWRLIWSTPANLHQNGWNEKKQLEWSSQSSDLNSVEMLWCDLKKGQQTELKWYNVVSKNGPNFLKTMGEADKVIKDINNSRTAANSGFTSYWVTEELSVVQSLFFLLGSCSSPLLFIFVIPPINLVSSTLKWQMRAANKVSPEAPSLSPFKLMISPLVSSLFPAQIKIQAHGDGGQWAEYEGWEDWHLTASSWWSHQ